MDLQHYKLDSTLLKLKSMTFIAYVVMTSTMAFLKAVKMQILQEQLTIQHTHHYHFQILIELRNVCM